ncbi:hypothetical protein NPIL_35101, partial [Nephila pilipes]
GSSAAPAAASARRYKKGVAKFSFHAAMACSRCAQFFFWLLSAEPYGGQVRVPCALKQAAKAGWKFLEVAAVQMHV